MREFKTIHNFLEDITSIKKIYLLGSTGAGKTSLVRSIIDTAHYAFPSTSQRRTTVTPTEYVIDRNRQFKTTIILKQKQDILNSIYDLFMMAIIRTSKENLTLEDVISELEQTPDDHFRLKFVLSSDSLKEKAEYILNELNPHIGDSEEEHVFSTQFLNDGLDRLVSDCMIEIEEHFKKICSGSHDLYGDNPYFIDGYSDKELFIKENKRLLANEIGSISPLVEYVRIEGNLLAEWIKEPNLKCILIDGEGIGHSLAEKRDTLSTRHLDYFNYCDDIFLIENGENPFISGGQGAIESIYRYGYNNKLKLIFSKVDLLPSDHTNNYFIKILRNLKDALSKEDIGFNITNNRTYKLANPKDKGLDDLNRQEIVRLLKSIQEPREQTEVPLEYDFNNLLLNLDGEKFIEDFQSRINPEHWAVIKALTKRIYDRRDNEYRHIKPVAWILNFIMSNVNLFLQKNDNDSSNVSDTYDKIKQEFSKKLLSYITENFIVKKEHLWSQAYSKKGRGSDRERKTFIFDNILKQFIPHHESNTLFNILKNDMKELLLQSGAKELQSATKISIDSVNIQKIYGEHNFKWNLNDSINVLLGKNGSGKSTILRLINACITNDQRVLEKYGFPLVSLKLTRTYENGDKYSVSVRNGEILSDVHSVLISTFDTLSVKANIDKTFLDTKLQELVDKFGSYQRTLQQRVTQETENESQEANEIRRNITQATSEDLLEYQKLLTIIEEVKKRINKPLTQFTEIINSYLETTNKIINIDDEINPFLVKDNNSKKTIDLEKLSSGEKQLVIILLTIVLQDNKPFILLMDEPEISLHVEWQSTLIDNISELNPNTQIIIATHNPLMTLNRGQNEIGVVIQGIEEIKIKSQGTKYLDISSILLEYFELSSLIGNDMQQDIKRFTELKLREEMLNAEELKDFMELTHILENSFAGDIIYNKKYFSFLKFLKESKGIDFQELDDIEEDEFQNFLKEFGGGND